MPVRCATLGLCACIIAVVMSDVSGAAPEEEMWHDESDQSKSARFLLRDTTEGKATEQLRSSWNFQVKSGDERHDSLVETFGKESHGASLLGMGFELVETEVSEGNGFTGTGYHNPAQLHKAFQELESKYPKQAKLIDLTAEYKQPKTKEGRSLYAMKISSNAAQDEAKPNVLLVSNHHARELMTPEIALNIATQLLEGHDKASKLKSGEVVAVQEDADEAAQDMKSILDANQVYVMYTMNPDGLNTVWTTDSWKRTNANNVDLNRNYPIGWSLSCGGSTDKQGETWRGDKPFSEAETKTMRAFQDDRNFAKVMDFHSYSSQVRTNYGDCAHLPHSIDSRFKTIRNAIATKMEYQPSRSCCMGGNIHYAYNRHGSLAYLVETGQAFQPPAHEKDATVAQVFPGVKRFLQQPISVSGIITDGSGSPVKAELKLPEFDFRLQEKHQSGARGHYHLWLPNGQHKVEVHVPGKAVKTLTLEAKEHGNVQNIQV